MTVEIAIQTQHLARQNYYRHVFLPLNRLDPNSTTSPIFLDTKAEGDKMPMSVTGGAKGSVMAEDTSGKGINMNFWDFDKGVEYSRMERHYRQQDYHQTLFLHQFQESATLWSSTSVTSTFFSQYIQVCDSPRSTPLTDCSPFDTDDSAPGWRFRKVKAMAKARSAFASPRNLARDPQILTCVQKSPLPPRPIHHWRSAIFQVRDTPCLGFQLGSLANETPLDFNFPGTRSSTNVMQNSPIADFVSSDWFVQKGSCRQVMVDRAEDGQRCDFISGSISDKKEEDESENEYQELIVDYEPWIVGLGPLALEGSQRACWSTRQNRVGGILWDNVLTKAILRIR